MMTTFIAQRIEQEYEKKGLKAAQTKYRAYFVSTRLYLSVKEDVDTILRTDGCEDCIVNE